MAEGARARLTEFEVRLPWTSVKKSWGPRREQWVAQVLSTLACETLGNLVLVLESALKSDTLDPSWATVHEHWKARVGAARTPEAIDRVVMELERAIQWNNLQLNRAGTIARPLPPSSICEDPSIPPPDGVPRATLRIMLLLRAMGVRSYSPAVVLQLYEAISIYLHLSIYLSMYVCGELVDRSIAPPRPCSSGRYHPRNTARTPETTATGTARQNRKLALPLLVR